MVFMKTLVNQSNDQNEPELSLHCANSFAAATKALRKSSPVATKPLERIRLACRTRMATAVFGYASPVAPFQGSVGVGAFSLVGQCYRCPDPTHQSPLTNPLSPITFPPPPPTHIALESIIFTPAMMIGR
jgi:hypothetical protein